MRHRKTGRKLNINSSHRKAMFRNMVTSLFKYDRIRTTDTKAKELRSLADHLVTLAKRGDLHARRQVLAVVREKDVVHKLFEEANERFGSVSGGYTRIVKIGRRPGDAALMSIIELVTPSGSKKKTEKKTAAPKPAVTKAPDVTPDTAVGKSDTATADASSADGGVDAAADSIEEEPVDSEPAPAEETGVEAAATEPVPHADADTKGPESETSEDEAPGK
jgi:large subunit ribosomal protein L17